MSERDFDIVVVGSGCAGAIAAYVAAKRGKSVLVVERGEFAGSKNMTGGRLYAHALRRVLDAYGDGEVDWDDIPFERKIVHERIAMMDKASSMTVDFTSEELGAAGQDSYSVLRAPFDQWLAGLAESAGCEFICGIAVEELVKDERETVVGVRAGEDVITAQVVIVAEGVNSLLTERCLGAPRPKRDEMAVGIKQTYELSESEIESRFLLPKGEGAAMLFVGDCTCGHVGGGFLYTNKNSIGIGLVATIENFSKSNVTICQALEDFTRHPSVEPMLRGARLVEHSGHMVSEGGYDMIPPYVHDGALVTGDSAMLCMNLGYMVRGMDFAIASGQYAAEAACEGIDAGSVSKEGLSSYQAKLRQSFVMQDLETYRAWPATMGRWDSLFADYPVMVKEMFNSMFVVDGSSTRPLRKRIFPIVKKRGLLKTAGEVRGALKAL